MDKNRLTYKITPSLLGPDAFKLEEESFNPLTDTMQQYTSAIFDLREKALRDALIALGWTPPGEKCQGCKDALTAKKEQK